MNRRQFLHTGASLAAIAFTSQAAPHHSANEAPFDSSGAQAPPLDHPIVSGSGEFRFEFVPDKIMLPQIGRASCRETVYM